MGLVLSYFGEHTGTCRQLRGSRRKQARQTKNEAAEEYNRSAHDATIWKLTEQFEARVHLNYSSDLPP